MNYQQLLKKVAKEFHTTPKEVEIEIRKAIRAAGYDISPEAFISLCVAKVRQDNKPY